MTRSNDHLTSSTVIGVPLANLTPSRMVNRQPLPSAVRAHLVASDGATLTYWPGVIVTSVSYAASTDIGEVYCARRAGSRVIVSLMSMAMTSVPLRVCASTCAG